MLCRGLLVLALWLSLPAQADIVSELGGGIKLPGSSYVLQPKCRKVIAFEPDDGRDYPCGGDNPAFIGWPVAWERPDGNLRVGWFHYSNWFDGGELSQLSGGDKYETQFNCLCVSWKFNWTSRLKKRRLRKVE